MPPRLIGPYRVVTALGSGGIGTVYRAVDSRSGEDVALKLLSSGPALDPNAARRMAREFEALFELDHPNVVRVFDTGVYRGYPYLAMEIIEGLNLRDYLAVEEPSVAPGAIDRSRSGLSAEEPSADGVEPFTPDRLVGEPNTDSAIFTESVDSEPSDHEAGPDALRRLANAADEPMTDEGPSNETPLPWQPEPKAEVRPGHVAPSLATLNRPQRLARLKDAFLQICEGLTYVHGRGLVHRDMKPGNVMVDDDRRVKLMDFGLAKFLADDGAVTASGRIVGTYRYMAPEQLLGERVDARADLYALGVMLYELMAGRPPYTANTPLQLWQQMLDREPPPLRSVNPVVDAVLARIAHQLMRRDPNERSQTSEEVYAAILESPG